MKVYSAASKLHKQMVALHNSDTTVSVLDSQLECLGQQSMMSTIEENQSQHLRLLLRVSVTEGVHQMYQSYSTRKWTQIQNTARSIKSSLEAGEHLPTTADTTVSTPTTNTRQDKAASEWTSIMCKLSRYE